MHSVEALPFKLLILVLLVLICPVASNANDHLASPAAGRVTFKDGQTIIFLGDSITHTWQQKETYCEFIENYYYTRYPLTRLHFLNAGVSGSRTKQALERFEQAVARHHPSYVVLMLGMNDAGYTDFNPELFQTYSMGMQKLLDLIAHLDATAIPMIPTLLDYRNVELTPGNTVQRKRDLLGNVSTLGYYGTWLREEALMRGLPIVDQAAGFNRFLWSVRRSDPNYMLAPDAIHPTPAGLWVMAHTFIETLETNRFASAVDLFLHPDTVEGFAEGGSLSDLARSNDVIRFTFQADSLPWVLPPEEHPLSKMSPSFAYRQLSSEPALSRERLRVIALSSNLYELKIDGKGVGQFSHIQLARGVDLQDNFKTPQYQQAKSVSILNAKKTHGPMFQLGLEYERVSRKGGPANDAILAPLEAQILDYEKQIYAANVPKPHRYEIAPISP